MFKSSNSKGKKSRAVQSTIEKSYTGTVRQKRKKILQKTVPVSTVLHSIAANYKPWKTRSSGEKIISIATVLSQKKSQK